jgi:hypothetical protein
LKSIKEWEYPPKRFLLHPHHHPRSPSLLSSFTFTPTSAFCFNFLSVSTNPATFIFFNRFHYLKTTFKMRFSIAAFALASALVSGVAAAPYAQQQAGQGGAIGGATGGRTGGQAGGQPGTTGGQTGTQGTHANPVCLAFPSTVSYSADMSTDELHSRWKPISYLYAHCR